MRIGLVTGEFPPMEGGVGAFTEQLARALTQLGHEIHVITSTQARPADTPRTVSSNREPLNLGYARLHARIGRWRWPSLDQVADIAIRYDLDAVNLQYQSAAFNMRSAAINFLPWRLKAVVPTVVTFHDLRVPYLFPKAGRWREHVVRELARRAGGCIATNAADTRILEEWTAVPVRQIPIGSNIEAYTPNSIEIEEVRKLLGLKHGDVLLGYFGFLNETKGADTLINSLAQMDDRYHLVFIGGQTGASDPANNQSFLEQLRRRIDQNGTKGRVHWTGFLSPERVSTHLVAADLMVMPYRDGVSLRRGTLMAVLAHGRPLITTTPAEPSPDFRHGENMWLVTPDDPQALVEGVRRLADDSSQRDALGLGAKDLARSFSWATIAGDTAQFLAGIIAKKSR